MSTDTPRDVEKAVPPAIVDVDSDSGSSVGKDEAYEIYKQNEDAEVSPEEEKRVLRIIDYRVMPLLFFIYTLQYLDKNVCLERNQNL